MTGKDILIVEDETIVAFDMKVRLEALGYRVVGLADGATAAFDLLERGKPDLVLMDIKLKGGEDGIEVAGQIRERTELPIIFVTAFTDEGTLDRAKRASPYGYIVKPFHERELRIAIELALYKFQYELSMRLAKELAEETSRLKSEFLANMSHELKTPLNSVIGFLELALDRKTDEEQGEYLSTALASAKRLVDLIDSILDFARLEAGRVSAHAAPFSIDELLEECVELLAVGAYAKGLEVFYRRSAALPSRALGDSGLIRKILLSLAENSVKFTERGMVGLAAELLAEASAGTAAAAQAAAAQAAAAGIALPSEGFILRLVLEDSGIGMSPERVGEAFQRFYQLDASHTRPAGGTGLGLAIVQKSVELLGGKVAVQSEEGRGCRFEVLIPLQRESEEAPQPAPKQEGGIVLAGFSADAVLDAMDSLRGLGLKFASAAELRRATELAGAGDFILADERLLPKELEIARNLGAKLVLCHRFGGKGRALAAEEGFRSLSLPLRPLALSRALAAPQPHTPLPRKERAGSRTGRETLESQEKKAQSGPRSVDKAPGSDPGLELLGRFAEILGAALDPLDCARIEREAKEYSHLIDQIGGRAYGRLVFSALLLARRGDGQGLCDLLGRVRAALALEGPS